MTFSMYCDFNLGSVSHFLLFLSAKNKPVRSIASDVCSEGAIVPVGRSRKDREIGVGVFVSVHEPLQVKGLSLDELRGEVVTPDDKLEDENPVSMALVCATELDDDDDGDHVDDPVLEELEPISVALEPDIDGLIMIEVSDTDAVEFMLNDAVIGGELL